MNLLYHLEALQLSFSPFFPLFSPPLAIDTLPLRSPPPSPDKERRFIPRMNHRGFRARISVSKCTVYLSCCQAEEPVPKGNRICRLH